MARTPAILLPLKDATLAQRWQLVHGLHAVARVAVEGGAIQLLILIVALVRTGWTPFAGLAVFVVAATIWRVRGARDFACAYAECLAAPEEGDPDAPEIWARRLAVRVSVMAAVLGVIDLSVLLRFDDTWLQMFALLLQAGWASAACVNFAGSPLLVALIAALTMGPSLVGAAFSHGAWMHVLVPAALIHFSALLRMGRSQGRVLASLLEAEGRAADASARLRVLSLTDPLTGLANRRGFDETLASTLRDSGAQGLPLALLMIDVDHFKRYNDHYGHPAGDACLAGVAQHLAAALRRRTDLAARYGGEEFAAILPDMDEAGGILVAERLRQALAVYPIPHATSPFGVVTVSIGVAVARPSEAESPSGLIARADAALYEAKRLGRNVIATARREDVPIAEHEAAALTGSTLTWATSADTAASAQAKADANEALLPVGSHA